MTEDQARERIEQMQNKNPSNRLQFMEQSMDNDYLALKAKYERLKRIIIGALVSIDILLKFGLPVSLFFWPLTQNGLAQAIGLSSLLLLLTIISKTITKVKTQD